MELDFNATSAALNVEAGNNYTIAVTTLSRELKSAAAVTRISTSKASAVYFADDFCSLSFA